MFNNDTIPFFLILTSKKTKTEIVEKPLTASV